MSVETAVTRIAVPEGFRVRTWTRVPGKERVYVTLLAKRNGGRNWNGGVGRESYFDVSARRWHHGDWAGAATRDAFGDEFDALTKEIEDALVVETGQGPTRFLAGRRPPDAILVERCCDERPELEEGLGREIRDGSGRALKIIGASAELWTAQDEEEMGEPGSGPRWHATLYCEEVEGESAR